MCYCAWLRRLLCRKLLTVVLATYVLTILLFFLNVDFTEPPTKSEESFSLIFPEASLYAKRSPGAEIVNTSSYKNRNSISKPHLEFRNSISDNNEEHVYRPLEEMRVDALGQEPLPLLEPLHDTQTSRRLSGDFRSFGRGAYVYSAFLDDRKEQTFVRIMALMSQKAAKQFFYCHFSGASNFLSVKSELYQLCENHNKIFGGYFYSCEVPEAITNLQTMTFIFISSTPNGPRVQVPILSVRPPDFKLTYLDVYPNKPYSTYKIQNKNGNVPYTKEDASSNSNTIRHSPTEPNLSFAVCVSPLFGNISFHRVVEFIELSRLLGVDHFIFYNHSIPQQVSDALSYYISRNIVSVLPWSLPKEVDSVWYYGQLLANNDCLYRTMPHFDLVSFNDIDEFIVPHSNASTWKQAFSSMLTADRCGFSFQSAFYDPGIREPFESTLLTPVLTAKSEMYSKVGRLLMCLNYAAYCLFICFSVCMCHMFL